MRFLFLNHNVAHRGATFFRAYAVGQQLTLLGHEVTLVSTSASSRFALQSKVSAGVTVVESPAIFPGRARSGWDPLDVVRRVLWCRSPRLSSIDVIHAFDSRPTVIIPALALRRRSGARLVIDWADWWGRGGTIEERPTSALVRSLVRGPETYFEESFRTRADATTVISRALRERALALGVPSETISILPSGSDIESIRPLDRAEARRESGLSEQGPIVGYLGAVLRRDHALLASTITELVRRRDDLRFLLIGNPGIPLPEHPRIIRTGFVPRDRLPYVLGACDVFLLPLVDSIANRGRWPSKINDYLAAGRPVVASAVGDIADLFARARIGALAGSETAALVTACLGLVDDPGRAAEIGRNARTLAETELSWGYISAGFLAAYEGALKRPLAPA
jgi:glycosyltransferase involved in cell wall biosynthesis